MQKDWKGNNTTIVSLGVHHYSDHDREQHDFYTTDPKAAYTLLDREDLNNIWENACGSGHLAKVFEERGLLGKATDLIDRGYGQGGIDFLTENEEWDGDIATNPPFKYAEQFIRNSLSIIKGGRKVCMFLRVQFLESKGRYKLWQQYPPKIIYVYSGRISCALNGNFEAYSSSAVPYAWYVWEKGYKKDPLIKWILI